MSTSTKPSQSDVDYALRLHERAKVLQMADRDLGYRTAVLRASEQLERSERIADPDHMLLTSMAQKWAIANGVNDFGRALRAVGPDYERIVAGAEPSAAAAVVARESEELDRAARRRMAEDRTLTYRDALLMTAAKTPPRPSSVKKAEPTADESGAVLDEESHPKLPTVAEIEAHAKKRGISYKQALLDLSKGTADAYKATVPFKGEK